MRTNYPIAAHLFQGTLVDQEHVHQIIGRQHWIEVAGTISVGQMHGSNNPVDANARVASRLHTRSAGVAMGDYRQPRCRPMARCGGSPWRPSPPRPLARR
jgi:hypothetical protein